MAQMSKQMERLAEMRNYWYGSVDALVNDLKDSMFEVEDVSEEQVEAWGEGIGGMDVLFTLKLGGVPGTIIITDVKMQTI